MLSIVTESKLKLGFIDRIRIPYGEEVDPYKMVVKAREKSVKHTEVVNSEEFVFTGEVHKITINGIMYMVYSPCPGVVDVYKVLPLIENDDTFTWYYAPRSKKCECFCQFMIRGINIDVIYDLQTCKAKIKCHTKIHGSQLTIDKFETQVGADNSVILKCIVDWYNKWAFHIFNWNMEERWKSADYIYLSNGYYQKWYA